MTSSAVRFESGKLFGKIVSEEGLRGTGSARSVPDMRQSGVERPGPVGPSAFVSVVFQGGVVYPLSSFALAQCTLERILVVGPHSYRTPSGESQRCCVAFLTVVATERRVCAPSRLARLNFIDKCSSLAASYR